MGSTPNAYNSEPLSALVIGFNKLCSANVIILILYHLGSFGYYYSVRWFFLTV